MTIERATRKLATELKKMFTEEEISVRAAVGENEGLFDITLYKSTQYTLNVFNKTGVISLFNHNSHVILDKKDFYQICLM